MLISKEVEVELRGKAIKWYERKGYKIPRRKDKKGRMAIPKGTKIKVKVQDLQENSNALIKVQCDGFCNKKAEIRWVEYNKHMKKNKKYYCKKCGLIGKSFGYWLIENLSLREAVSILARWDYENNKCDPRDIGYLSRGFNNKGYYFKCFKHLDHKSELKSINDFVNKRLTNLDCNQCNSFAQWGINNIDKDFLEKYWDYDKNNNLGLDPWEISHGSSTKKVWIKCQEKSYHDSYDILPNTFINHKDICPYCNHNSGKLHPLDSLGQYIINNYGQEFLDKIWSDKNKKSPFKYTPKNSKEVWWCCPDKKHKNFKRSISSSNKAEFRCPKCTQERDESIIQEKVRLYLESLGYDVLHEYKCTLYPKNPIKPPSKRKTTKLRYDNEIIINNNHLFIEVMGEQHEKNNSLFHVKSAKRYKTIPQQEFDYLQAKDKYKEQYVYKQGNNYYYLAVWYYNFDKQDTYKKLIDDKINKILKEAI